MRKMGRKSLSRRTHAKERTCAKAQWIAQNVNNGNFDWRHDYLIIILFQDFVTCSCYILGNSFSLVSDKIYYNRDLLSRSALISFLKIIVIRMQDIII